MKTIWGLKETVKVRLDLKKANTRPELHPRQVGSDTIILLVVPYVLTKVEKAKFMNPMRHLRTPNN